jgi:serine phosphatase RsbU (regulator of sigma subunit)
VETGPGLPLGVVTGTVYDESEFSLDTQLTLVSDGVIEAANTRGELFGFERTAALSKHSAQEIAQAARAWGQNDDITVVTVRRSG